jgi:ribosomal protein L40E
MSVFENFTRKVSETAKAAAKKSSDLVEVTKLNMSIGSEEDKIEKVFKEIGKTIYESFARGENVDEIFIEKCNQIASYEDNIKDMRAKVLELKNSKVCPNCREELDIEVQYCSKCGTKQEIPEPVVKEELPDDKVCPNCNTVCDQESLFCSTCGTKIEE